MTANGKLEVVVRSKKTLSRVDSYEVSTMGVDGLRRVSRRSVNVFDYVLDEQQSRALEEARDLAARSGFALEVVDLTRRSPLLRLVGLGRALLGQRFAGTASPLRSVHALPEPRGRREPSSAACPP